MDTEIVWALLGVLVALLGVAATTIAVLLRARNGAIHNPNYQTLELLLKQQVHTFESMDEKLNKMVGATNTFASMDAKLNSIVLGLSEIQGRVRDCPARTRSGGTR
jgi:hypothetical protein